MKTKENEIIGSRSTNGTVDNGLEDPLAATVEVDVDELSPRLELPPTAIPPTSPVSRGIATPCRVSPGGHLKVSVTAREFSAIARELDEVDRLAKESSAPPNGAHYTTDSAAKQKEPAPKRTSHRQPMLKKTSSAQSATATDKDKDKDKMERDMVAQDDEINPVLLRHLAEDIRPGAFASHTRPPNLQFTQHHEALASGHLTMRPFCYSSLYKRRLPQRFNTTFATVYPINF
jgi:hypothetical protein